MKAANFALSILILVFAAVSAVFSYILFEKRTQLTDGWKQMAEAINKTSGALDNGSGTGTSRELSVQALDYSNYGKLKSLLPKLINQAKNVTAQRNMLAESLYNIGGIIGMDGLAEETSFSAVATSAEAANGVVENVRKVIEGRDKFFAGLVSDFHQYFNCDIDNDTLRRISLGNEDAFAVVSGRIKFYGDLRNGYENALIAIAGDTGVPGLTFNDNNAQEDAEKVRDAVKAQADKLNAAEREIENLRQTLKDKDEELAFQNQVNEELNRKNSGLQEQIAYMKTVLGLSEEEPLPDVWQPGGDEVRRHVNGEVTLVNSRYGFIEIALGRNTRVEQTLGNKIGLIDPKLVPGMEMTVSRGDLESSGSEFISRIRLTRVEGDYSIAEPVGDNSKPIKVGDRVWFDLK